MKTIAQKLAAQALREARLEFVQGESLTPGGFYNQEVFTEKFSKLLFEEFIKVCRDQRGPSTLNYDPFEKLEEELRREFCIYEDQTTGNLK